MNRANRLILLPLFLAAAACGGSDVPGISAADLRSAAGESEVSEFYEANGWQAVWSDEAERDLRQALEQRAAHGLDRVPFLTSDEGSPALREAALTRAALTYASALARGLVDPGEQYELYTIPRPEPDLTAGLAEALASERLEDWFAGLAPRDAEYRALSEAYQELRGAAQGEESAAIPAGPPVRAGERDPRVPQIAAALRREGYLQESEGEAPPQSDLFTPEMADALRRLQEERGLDADGIAGPEALRLLDAGPADRARALAVALERRRWLTRDPPATRIDVNTAAAMLSYVRDGTLADSRRVIVGQPDWQTPQLQSQFYRFVANPTWTVPKSIEEDEMANVSAAYLSRNNMVRRDGWIVQRPGPDNALGLVKFDLDNDNAIYLHDTPAKTLFEENQRQLSHGCIRVYDALGFAQMIARDQGVSGEWQEASASGETTFVRLPEPITVRLLYHPTYLDADAGVLRFVPDVYGWSGPIGEQLGFGAGGPVRTVPHVPDLGP